MKEKQFIFIQNVAKLILWAFDNGFQLTAGEALRTADQQLLYFDGYSLVKTGGHIILAKAPRRTATMASKHLEKLAIDLNVFISGVYTTDKTKLQPLGDYWQSLHPDNVWGGNWKNFLDTPHFQMGR